MILKSYQIFGMCISAHMKWRQLYRSAQIHVPEDFKFHLIKPWKPKQSRLLRLCYRDLNCASGYRGDFKDRS